MRLHGFFVNRIAATLASTCLLAGLAFGQNISSSVLGMIVDPSGAPVPGAGCELTDQATGASLKTVWRFPVNPSRSIQ